jgi:ribosomal protein S18 acetylase RimI-like enzyme
LVTFEWSDWRNCNIWYLQSVFVEQTLRRQGIFRKMYEWVVQEAKLAGSHVIRLYVETDNVRAQGVYESVGMKRLPYVMYEAHL